MGLIYFSSCKKTDDEAIDNSAYNSIDESIVTDKPTFESYILRGDAKLKAKRYKEAEENYTTGLNIKPKSFDALNKRGHVRTILKAYKGALEDF